MTGFEMCLGFFLVAVGAGLCILCTVFALMIYRDRR